LSLGEDDLIRTEDLPKRSSKPCPRWKRFLSPRITTGSTKRKTIDPQRRRAGRRQPHESGRAPRPQRQLPAPADQQPGSAGPD